MDYTLNKTSGDSKDTVKLNKAQIRALANTLSAGIKNREAKIDASVDPSETFDLAKQNKFAKELLEIVNNASRGFAIESESSN